MNNHRTFAQVASSRASPSHATDRRLRSTSDSSGNVRVIHPHCASMHGASMHGARTLSSSDGRMGMCMACSRSRPCVCAYAAAYMWLRMWPRTLCESACVRVRVRACVHECVCVCTPCVTHPSLPLPSPPTVSEHIVLTESDLKAGALTGANSRELHPMTRVTKAHTVPRGTSHYQGSHSARTPSRAVHSSHCGACTVWGTGM